MRFQHSPWLCPAAAVFALSFDACGPVDQVNNALGSDPTDPVFAPEERGNESLALFTAALDEEIERVFLDLPEVEAVEPLTVSTVWPDGFAALSLRIAPFGLPSRPPLPSIDTGSALS